MTTSKSTRARSTKQADPTRLLDLVIGKWVCQALSVSAELGVADVLKDRTKSAADIAKAVDSSEDAIYRLLRALGSVGLFEESPGKKFKLTPLGKLLQTGTTQSFKGFAQLIGHECTWLPWGELRHSTRTGKPAFDLVFGMPVFEYFGKAPDAAGIFHQAMTSLSSWESEAVVHAYSFAGIRTLVDVAGGHGLLLSTILREHKKLRGILFDLPPVVSGADVLLQRQGVASRCQVVGGDFFAGVPEGADAYMLKHIVHDWDDPRAAQILQNCRQAMAPGGRVLIAEIVIGRRNAGKYGKLLDLEMLVLTPHGRERTEEEYAKVLSQAGLKLRKVIPTKTYLSILEAVKA